jgi:hypothetical protein
VAVEANGMDAVSEFLGDNYAKGKAGGIGFENKLSCPIRGIKNW